MRTEASLTPVYAGTNPRPSLTCMRVLMTSRGWVAATAARPEAKPAMAVFMRSRRRGGGFGRELEEEEDAEAKRPSVIRFSLSNDDADDDFDFDTGVVIISEKLSRKPINISKTKNERL